MVKNYFQYGSRPPSWIFKIFIFVHMTVIEFQVCRCVPNFHQNQISFRWDMTIFMMALAIFNLWNLEFMLCDLFIAVLSLFPVQNFTEIGQSAAKIRSKTIFNTAAVAILNFNNFHIWSSDFRRVTNLFCLPNFIKIGWFFVEMWRFNDFQDDRCPPSWSLEVQECVL